MRSRKCGRIGRSDGYIAAGSFSANVSSWGRHGRFWSSVSELGLVAVLIISIVIMGVGIAFLKWGNKEDETENGVELTH
ncbi:MAG: hypothetical protein FWC32_07620 [Firmicutes bacterium]|nr:hypothetical protein [Bacillota bacterium]